MTDTLILILESNIAKNLFINSNDTVLRISYLHQNTSSNNSLNLAILIPIIAVIIGGIITLLQVRGNTITNARILWIENFRNSVAEYCAFAEKAIMQIANMVYKKEKGGNKMYDGFLSDYDKYFTYHCETTKYSNKIKLYLNIKEKKPKKIENLINKIDKDISSSFNQYNEKYENQVKDNIINIVKISRIIIKEEWEKSKTYFPWVKKIIIKLYKEYKSL